MVNFVKKVFNRIWYRNYLRFNLGSVGKDFRFGYGGNLECPCSFYIGNNFFCGPYAFFASNKKTKVEIGNDVMLGPKCMIIAGNHNTTDFNSTMRLAPKLWEHDKGIVIEDDVWIGAGSCLLDGALVSEGTVIAAGAIVTKKTVPYSIYGGVPARFIKMRFSRAELATLLKNNNSKYCVDEILSQIPVKV